MLILSLSLNKCYYYKFISRTKHFNNSYYVALNSLKNYIVSVIPSHNYIFTCIVCHKYGHSNFKKHTFFTTFSCFK